MTIPDNNTFNKMANFFIIQFDVNKQKMLHDPFHPCKTGVGKKDLALWLHGTYFAAQSALHKDR